MMVFGGNRVGLTVAELAALPQFSHSVPHGNVLGLRWKRKSIDGWWMLEYVLDHKRHYATIKKRVVIELP